VLEITFGFTTMNNGNSSARPRIPPARQAETACTARWPGAGATAWSGQAARRVARDVCWFRTKADLDFDPAAGSVTPSPPGSC
jgi:hypothetical protein